MAVLWSIALADRINLLKAEREKANLEVQASERRYRQLVETMNDGLAVADAESRLTYVKNRLAEMLGYPAEAIIGKPTTDFIADEDNRQILASQLETRKTGSSRPYELTWRRKDGEDLYTIISPVPLFGYEGRYSGAFAVVTDITERVRAGRHGHTHRPVRADGVGPYKLGALAADVLDVLPSGPRIRQFTIPGVVHRDMLRGDDDAILIGTEPQGKVMFVAVVRADIARTESGIQVGSTRDELENAGAAIQSTIQGESSASPVATQLVMSTR